MGAQSASATIKARNITEAWEMAYERAVDRSGHQDGYSGDLNTCDFTKDLTSKLNTMSEKELIDYIYENCPKWEAWGFCSKAPKENKNKVKSTVDRKPQKGARKWVTKYVGTGWEGNPICEASTLTECIKKARTHTEKTGERVTIDITKKLEKGNYTCAVVNYKKSKTEALGTYIFIGLAAC